MEQIERLKIKITALEVAIKQLEQTSSLLNDLLQESERELSEILVNLDDEEDEF